MYNYRGHIGRNYIKRARKKIKEQRDAIRKSRLDNKTLKTRTPSPECSVKCIV